MIAIQRAQRLLKALGFTLAAYGTEKVSFYVATAPRTKEGLVVPRYWFDLDEKLWWLVEGLLVRLEPELFPSKIKERETKDDGQDGRIPEGDVHEGDGQGSAV